MSNNQFAVLPSNPADRKKILNGLKEVSDAMTRIEGERGYISDSLKVLGEEFEIKPAVLRKLARLYHNQDAASEKAKLDDIFSAFEVLTGVPLE